MPCMYALGMALTWSMRISQYYTYYGLLSVVLSPSLQLSSVASTLFYAVWSLFAGRC